jgi:hypothetical protein
VRVRAEMNVAERVEITVRELSGNRRAMDLTPARTSSFLSWSQLLVLTLVLSRRQAQRQGREENGVESREGEGGLT